MNQTKKLPIDQAVKAEAEKTISAYQKFDYSNEPKSFDELKGEVINKDKSWEGKIDMYISYMNLVHAVLQQPEVIEFHQKIFGANTMDIGIDTALNLFNRLNDELGMADWILNSGNDFTTENYKEYKKDYEEKLVFTRLLMFILKGVKGNELSNIPVSLLLSTLSIKNR